MSDIFNEEYQKATYIMSFIEKMRTLFRGSKRTSTAQLLMHVSRQIQELTDTLESQIEAAASGRHGTATATLEYVLQDCDGGELQTEWQDFDYVTYDDIVQTTGFQSLQQKAATLGVKLELVQEEIEEVDDEERMRFIIYLSGWGGW